MARVALVAAGLTTVLYMARGTYQIGLDHQGGASVSLSVRSNADDIIAIAENARWRVEVDRLPTETFVRLSLDNGTDEHLDQLLDRLRRLPQPPTVEHRFVIAAGKPRWQVAPLVIGVALLSIASWLAAFFSRRREIAVGAASLLAWSVTVAYMLHAGGVYTRTLWFSGLVWVVPLALFARCASRAPATIGARLISSWTATIALLVAFVVPMVVNVLYQRSTDNLSLHLVAVGIKHSLIAAPAIIVVAALTILGTPESETRT